MQNRIIKRIFLITAVLLLMVTNTIVCALEATENDNQKIYDELYQESGADKLFSKLPSETQDNLKKQGITGIDTQKLLSLSFKDVLKLTIEGIKKEFTKPFEMFCACIGVILLCAVLNIMKHSMKSRSSEKTFSLVSVIALSSIIMVPISKMITDIAKIIEEISDFLLVFVPVYTGIITASGKPISSLAAGGFLMGAAEVTSKAAATILVPMIGVYTAICLVSSVASEINIDSAATALHNTVIGILTFLLTIFVGLLGVQGTIAASSDGVAMKAVKFVSSAFLPIVGGAVSEALNSLEGCMGVLKSTVGGFGIVVIATAFLPCMISMLLTKFFIWIAQAVSDILDIDKVGGLLKNVNKVLSLLISIILVYMILIIVCLAFTIAMTR